MVLYPLFIDVISGALAELPEAHHGSLKEGLQFLPVEVTVSVKIKEIEDKPNFLIRR